MFGLKHGYKVDANQELVAQGASNLLGSFFQCLPIAGSLSRSMVQESSGCRSMLTSLTSCIFLLLVLLFGDHVEALRGGEVWVQAVLGVPGVGTCLATMPRFQPRNAELRIELVRIRDLFLQNWQLIIRVF